MVLNVTEEQKKLIESQGYMVVEFKLWFRKLGEMLIDATETRENCMTGKEYDKPVYEKWQLEQIARHLLVFCGKCEE